MTTRPSDSADDSTRAIVAQALRLTESQRVLVAAELLQSVEGPVDDRSDEEWLAEVNRRADRVRRGEANGKPWPVVRDELRTKLRK